MLRDPWRYICPEQGVLQFLSAVSPRPAEGAGLEAPLSCGPNWLPRHIAHAHISLQVSSFVPDRGLLGCAQRAVFNQSWSLGRVACSLEPERRWASGMRGCGADLKGSGGASGSPRGRDGRGATGKEWGVGRLWWGRIRARSP